MTRTASKLSLALLSTFAFSVSACAAETQTPKMTPADVASAAIDKTGFDAPASAWRDVDPENLLIIDTDYGQIGVELYPEIAPKHVAQIKALTRQSFYDMITFHRVIDGFMNQTGDPKGDGTGDSSLPDIEAEFKFRRPPSMAIELIDARKTPTGEVGVGFYKALPVASQPAAQAMLTKDGKVEAYGLHCTSFKVGTKGDNPSFVPDVMKKVRIAADIPESERPRIQTLKADSPAFDSYLATQKDASGNYPDICDITIPNRKLQN